MSTNPAIKLLEQELRATRSYLELNEKHIKEYEESLKSEKEELKRNTETLKSLEDALNKLLPQTAMPVPTKLVYNPNLALSTSPKSPKKRNRKAVEVNGNHYPSLTHAAKAFNISRYTVYKRCASDHYPTWILL